MRLVITPFITAAVIFLVTLQGFGHSGPPTASVSATHILSTAHTTNTASTQETNNGLRGSVAARKMLSCQDTTDFFFVEVLDREASCEWVARKRTQKRCNHPSVRMHCPLTCAACCSDKPGKFIASKGIFAGEKKSCQWVRRRPKARCPNHLAAQEHCPQACGTCPLLPPPTPAPTTVPTPAPTPAPTTVPTTAPTPGPTQLPLDTCVLDANIDAITEAMKLLAYGYALPETTDPSSYNPLIPYEKNGGSQPLFDTTKISQYLTEKFECSTAYENYSIIEESISEFAQELSTKTNTGGSFLGAFTANVASSFKLQKRVTEQTYFSQRRVTTTFGFSKIPSYGDVGSTDLQNLMDETTLTDIMNLETTPVEQQNATAADLVKRIGIGFVSTVYLGSLFTMTSSVERASWMTSEEVGTALDTSLTDAEMGFSTSTSIEVDIKDTTSGATSTSTFDLALYGGDPTQVGDLTAWPESAKQNPAIISYQLTPIYDLFPTDSVVYTLLKNAVDDAISKFGADIPGFGYKPIVELARPEASPNDFLPGHEGGSDIQVYIPTYLDPGYLPFGHSYDANALIPVIKVDGIVVKETNRYIQVWNDRHSGWDHNYAIWVPTMDDGDFDPLGYVVTKSHHPPTDSVAMVHSSYTQFNALTADSIWYSRDHIGGSHRITLYGSLWPGWPNGDYDSALITSVGIVPGFPYHKPPMALTYEKVAYDATPP